MGSARVGFGVLAQPFPVLDPRRTVSEPKCPKIPFFGVILEPVARIVNRRFLQVILPSWEVLVSVSEFWRSRFPFRTPGGPFSSPIV